MSEVTVTAAAGTICLFQQDLQQQGWSVNIEMCCPVAVGLGKQEEGT
jgi:hypothetical protein